MLIIPAVDLRAGRVVRLTQGDFTKETFYSGDPVKIAKNWEAEGAKLLHIVDLDGAFAGAPKNLGVIEEIKGNVKIPVEMGGGLRTDEVIERVLEKGIDRVVISTRAYTDEEFLKRILERFGERIVVSIDAAGEKVATEGWRALIGLNAAELARQMQGLGVKTIIYTNVLRDGTLEKPQLPFIEDVLNAVSIDVMVAGGISSLDDIKDIKALGRPNIAGVIVGKALYEGRLDLKEANRIAEG